MQPEPYWASDDGDVTLHLGDCLDVLRTLPADSVDAIVTDPPYAIGFMGKTWDSHGAFVERQANREHKWDHVGGNHNPVDSADAARTRRVEGQKFQQWCERWAREALRVLKPGGYMLAFGGTRTWHRLVCGVEDAGFEVGDSVASLTGQDAPALMWVYGSGFPKSRDVGRSVDMEVCTLPGRHCMRSLPDDPAPDDHVCPESEEGRPWQGHGTALKPAWEPVMVARKPLEGTVAGNVLRYGTGALNIDACKVAHASAADRAESEGKNRHADFGSGPRDNHVFGSDERDRADQGNYDGSAGRWPTNLVLTHSAACESAGTRRVRGNTQGTRRGGGRTAESNYRMRDQDRDGGYADADGLEEVAVWVCAADCPVGELDRQSGAVRSSGTYAKGSRLVGSKDGPASIPLDGLGSPQYTDTGGASRFYPVFKYQAKAPASERPRLEDGEAHPTVKPLGFISWACRLITPPGGTVLDMFCGSGVIGEAAIVEGFRCILIDQDPKSAELTRKRLAKPIQPVMFGLDAS